MVPGNKESRENRPSRHRDMISWGLKPRLTITTHGAFGLTKAAGTRKPLAEWTRCREHEMRDVWDELPEDVPPLLKPWLEAGREVPSCKAGNAMSRAFVEKS